MAEVARLVTRGLPEAVAPSCAELRSVHDLLAAWLDRQERRPDVKHRTVEHYRLAARHMVAWIGEVPVERLDLLTLERYRDDRLNEGASPRVVNQELKGLRTAWNWAAEAGLIPGGTLPRVKAKVRAGGEGAPGYGHLKQRLAGAIEEHFAEARARRTELLADPAELDRILARGAERARERAVRVRDRAFKACGLR